MDFTTSKKLNEALDTSLKEHNLEQLNSYFSAKPDCSDVLNKTTISTLMKLLKKEKKYGDRSITVGCVLSCLQHFLDSNIDAQIWQQLSEDIGKLFDATFSLTVLCLEEEVIRECSVLFTDIVEHCSELADDVLKFTFKSLLKTATAAKYANVRFEVLTLVNTLMPKTSRELRREVIPCNLDQIVKLSECLVASGCYELQATIVEVLARSRVFMASTEDTFSLFPTQPQYLAMFSKYTFTKFDPECRLFLNEVNDTLGTDRLIHSLPVMIVNADNVQLKKPVDPLYQQFWVDFNSSPESISLYYMNSDSLQQNGNWDVMMINFDSVTRVTAKNSQCRTKSQASVIDAIKLEIHQTETPKYIKIHLPKNNLFETLEKVLLKPTLNERYESEIEFESRPRNRSQSSSRKPVRSMAENLPDASFINISKNINPTPEKTVNSSMEDSNEVSPTPSPSVRNSRLQTHETESKLTEHSTRRFSDSFIEYLKQKEALSEKGKSSDHDNIAEDANNNLAGHHESRMLKEPIALDSKTETFTNKIGKVTIPDSEDSSDDGCSAKAPNLKDDCLKTTTTRSQIKEVTKTSNLDFHKTDEDEETIKTSSHDRRIDKSTSKSNTKSSTKEKVVKSVSSAKNTEKDNQVTKNTVLDQNNEEENTKIGTKSSQNKHVSKNATLNDYNTEEDDDEGTDKENVENSKENKYLKSISNKSQNKDVKNVEPDGNSSEEDREQLSDKNSSLEKDTSKSNAKSLSKEKDFKGSDSEDEPSGNEDEDLNDEDNHSSDSDWEADQQKKNNDSKITKHNLNTRNASSNLKSDGKSNMKSSQREGRISNEDSHSKDNQKSSVANKSIPRKRLYSYQKDEAIMLSSQDDILSVGVPSYKITKAKDKIKPTPKVDRKNVTFSYINHKEKKGKLVKEKNVPSLLGDEIEHKLLVDESDEENVNKETTPKKKDSLKVQGSKSKSSLTYENASEALSKALNKSKSSNIPSRSIYSDFSSAEKNPRAKKTYGKPKPKKGKRIINFLSSSSDSDPDFDVPAKVSPKIIQTRGRKRKNESGTKPSGFADRLDMPKIDPTRGCSATKSRRMEIDKVPFEETIETRVIYQQEIVKGPKKGKAKNTSQVSKKKTASKVTKKAFEEDLDHMSEDADMDFVPDMDIVPCQSKELSEPMEDDWALDIFNNPPSQDRKLLQATYKINDMVQVGKSCTLQVKTKLSKVQSLAQKEREMNISAFDYKVQSSVSSMQTHFQKLEAATKTLAKTKVALDSTYNLLKETTAQLEAEASRIENAKKELKKNLAQADKSETTSVTSIFQGFGRYMRSVVLSLIQNNQKEK